MKECQDTASPDILFGSTRWPEYRSTPFWVGLCVNLHVVGVTHRRNDMCSRTGVAVISVLGVLEEKKDMMNGKWALSDLT